MTLNLNWALSAHGWSGQTLVIHSLFSTGSPFYYFVLPKLQHFYTHLRFHRDNWNIGRGFPQPLMTSTFKAFWHGHNDVSLLFSKLSFSSPRTLCSFYFLFTTLAAHSQAPLMAPPHLLYLSGLGCQAESLDAFSICMQAVCDLMRSCGINEQTKNNSQIYVIHRSLLLTSK